MKVISKIENFIHIFSEAKKIKKKSKNLSVYLHRKKIVLSV